MGLWVWSSPGRPAQRSLGSGEQSEAGEVAYSLVLVSRAPIEASLQNCRVPRWAVRTIFLEDENGHRTTTSLARTLGRLHDSGDDWVWRGWSWGRHRSPPSARTSWGLAESRSQLLSAEVSALTTEVAGLARDLERREAEAATPVVPVAEFLALIQQAKPSGTEITAISVEDGEARASIISLIL